MNNKTLRKMVGIGLMLTLTSCLPVSKEEQTQIASSSTGTLYKPLAVSYHRTCVMSQVGALKCWGLQDSGELGIGTTVALGHNVGDMGSNLVAANMGTGRSVKAIGMGDSHACAILDNDKVKCWGYNGNGELGQGDTANRGDQAGQMGDNLPYVDLGTGRTAKQISAGGSHTCVILDNNKMKCWGYNNDGELGIETMASMGDQAGEMGDNLPYVMLGTGRTAKVISSAGHNTCAILDNDKVKCWGHNGFGQLGLGHNTGVTHNTGGMGDNLPYIDLGTGRTAKTITTAGFFSCAVLDNDKTKCWGRNNYGQLGQGDTNDRGDQANEMGDNLDYIDLGTNDKAESLSTFYDHVCAVLTTGGLKCWGYNNVGQLGLGDTNNRGDQSGEMGNSLPAISLGTGKTAKAVAAGHAHTCAILNDYSVKCWGSGWTGGLGNESNGTIGDQANQMGDNLAAVNTGF